MSTDPWKLYNQGLREEGSEETKLEIVKKMLSENFSIKDIIKVTDLSEDKINSLK